MENTKILLIKNLKRLRKANGWTQENLSEKSGISLGFIREIETGKALGSATTIDQLASVFGVKIHELFIEEASENDELSIMRKIISLGPVELELLKDSLEELSKPVSLKSKNKQA